MIPKHALIIGMGVSGQSTLHFLHDRCDVYVTDTRLNQDEIVNLEIAELRSEYPNATFIAPADIEDYLTPETIVYASPGLPLSTPIFTCARSQDARISCDVELFLSQTEKPVVGITGTNGKSTVTAMVGEMLSDSGFAVGGNIGVPALSLLDVDANGYVLELSSFQLERMRPPRLRSATLLNLTPDHIDHHGSFDAYAAAKHRIYEACEIAVFDHDEPKTRPSHMRDSIPVNGTSDWGVQPHAVVVDGNEIPREEIMLSGRMNHMNLCIASALAHTCGGTSERAMHVARTYTGLPHRTQLVAEIDAVRYINDSKATNVAATYAAISSLGSASKNIVWLAGGDGKSAEFNDLASVVKNNVKQAILYGRDARKIGAAILDVATLIYVDNLAKAVEVASSTAQAGDVVLLSPACASFDMFRDYQDRGERFEEIVKRLAA